MENRNISDIIEQYLKNILANTSSVEIKRAEIAERFQCVPSQINYVINTRFTTNAGYLVQSKRGGNGYIRIEKIKLRDETAFLDILLQTNGMELNESQGRALIQTLYKNEFLTRMEANLLLTVLSHQALQSPTKKEENEVRAQIVRSLLNRLKYKN